MSDIRDLDLEATTKDKVLYVAVALPLLGALGAVLRVFGDLSEQVTLMVVLPLQCVSFVVWHLGRAITRARRADAGEEQSTPRVSDTQSAHYVQRRMHARPE